MLPRSLRLLLDGKRQVELGVPARADVGDVLQSLFMLYPKLRQVVSTERRVVRQQLMLWMGERATNDLAHQRSGLREGERLYLCALAPEPVRLPALV